MSELGFPDKFVKWIMQCLNTVSYSILVNGSPSTPIQAKKGLRADNPYVTAMFNAFTKFSEASGLMANLHKSEVYVAGVSDSFAEILSTKLGILRGSFPFKYLGVPLTKRKLSYAECKPLIGKTVARIQSWSAKLLSYAGRLQLIKSFLCGIQLKAPVAWDHVCLPKSCGGWNLKDLTV
ncbi:uncharacterized protein [Spinacia oleracea]|uniref:Reverse transcriptase domain-containing protein n=1 Tax=Spinacia oleracea TaxID=3562 RepID=A0ABM3QZ97_SPIOL|nr:uncharacterized protein LOC130463508 [Spinacia oleracea]